MSMSCVLMVALIVGLEEPKQAEPPFRVNLGKPVSESELRLRAERRVQGEIAIIAKNITIKSQYAHRLDIQQRADDYIKKILGAIQRDYPHTQIGRFLRVGCC